MEGPSINLVKVIFAAVLVFTNANEKRPNIVIFIADDLGYGDVGCFGNTTLKTPNIDRIGKEGTILTHHLAASSMCSPSRAALLTGRYPIRSGMVPTGPVRINIFVASMGGLPQNETTFVELAQEVGYKTALIGKWHLGLSTDSSESFEHHPKNNGFDYFYGLPLTNLRDFGKDGDKIVFGPNPHWYMSFAMVAILSCIVNYSLLKTKYIQFSGFLCLIIASFIPILYFLLLFGNMKTLNSMIMKEFDVVEQPMRLEGLTDRFSLEGIEFMEDNTRNKTPFLLIISYTHVHTAIEVTKQFSGRTIHGRYGDAVEEMDSGIGQVLSSIDRLGIADNTLVYFTSDNGAHKEERGINGEIDGGYNGILKGGKSQGAVDGGIRVPTVIRWPGKIQANQIINEPTWQMDLFTTLADVMKVKPPTDRQIDGKNILPLLSGEEKISPHEFFVHYCGEDVHAVRYRPRTGKRVWKLVYKTPNYLPGRDTCEFICNCRTAVTLEKPVLYDMTSDPGEKNPLDTSESPEYQEIASKIDTALQNHKESVIDVEKQFSLWNIWWRPYLQICCDFPSCYCKDPKYA